MKKEFRILKKKEFDLLISAGKKIENTYFIIHYLKGQEHPRIGICLSKKIGGSVIRNKIKRQVRSMIDEIKPTVSVDYIIIIKQNYSTDSYHSIAATLSTLFVKIERNIL